MSDVRTFVLIESDKLRNLQENLKSFYELNEKYEELKKECEHPDKAKCLACGSSALINDEQDVGGSKPMPSSSENVTEKNNSDEASLAKTIDKQTTSLRVSPENLPLTSNIEEWYQIL